MDNTAITVSNPRPSTCLDGGTDFDVYITIGALSIEGEITLAPSDYDGRLESYGTSIDSWMTAPLANGLRDAVLSANGGESDITGDFKSRDMIRDICSDVIDAAREAV